MPNVTNQVRLRTGLELKHPVSKQTVLMNREKRPSQRPGGRQDTWGACRPIRPKPTVSQAAVLRPS